MESCVRMFSKSMHAANTQAHTNKHDKKDADRKAEAVAEAEGKTEAVAEAQGKAEAVAETGAEVKQDAEAEI